MAMQDYLRNGGINPQKPNQPAPVLQQDPMQRQAVMDQLAPAPQPTAAAPAGQSAASPGAGRFNRGGEVTQLPGSGAEMTNRLVGTGASIAATAAGAANPVTIGTNYLGNKLKPKEEMPTFGGEFGHLTDQYGRRFEGAGPGVAGGAVKGAGYGAFAGPIGAGVGAAIGAIAGAATKNAPSAFSDFRVEDASDAIAKAYQEYLGRPASDDEIESQLVGQGWNPTGGDRWVGEKGLNFVLGQIKNSPEAQQRATRGAVMEQLAGGAASPAGKPGQTAMSTPGAATAAGDVVREPGAGIPGAVRIEGAASGPVDSSAWDTDGYAAPAFTAPQAGAVPDGWDATKWNNPNHQTPKYAVGRILSQFPPTVEGLTQAFEQIKQAYPGATFNGKDKISIPGVGTNIDVLKGASVGGQAWRWDGGDEARGAESGGSAPSGGGGATGAGVDTGAAAQTSTADAGTLDKIRAELERIIAGQPSRDALLAQLGT